MNQSDLQAPVWQLSERARKLTSSAIREILKVTERPEVISFAGGLPSPASRTLAAAGGVPQDVEWAVAKDLPFPDSVFILQHRPETTWPAAPAAVPAPAPAANAQPGPAAQPSFDPVQYALRNVFKVPGA